MNDTEKIEPVCVANCPLNRVITVTEIGEVRHHYFDFAAIEAYPVPAHFECYPEAMRRHLVLKSIEEIGGFTLPVFEFKKVRKPGFLGWFGSRTIEYKKVDEVSGGWIRFNDGERILVSETFEKLKKLIEGGNSEKKEGNP